MVDNGTNIDSVLDEEIPEIDTETDSESDDVLAGPPSETGEETASGSTTSLSRGEAGGAVVLASLLAYLTVAVVSSDTLGVGLAVVVAAWMLWSLRVAGDL